MFYNPKTGAVSETGGPGMVNIDLYVRQPDILMMPGSRNAQAGSGIGVDQQGNYYTYDDEGAGWIPTGRKGGPQDWAAARQEYMRSQAGPSAAAFANEQTQAAANAAATQDRYNAYQQAAGTGVTGSGLQQVGTRTDVARDFLNTEAPGKSPARVQSSGNDIYSVIAANNPDIIRTAKYEHPEWTDQQAIDDWFQNTPERNQFSSLDQVAQQRNSMNWYLKVLGAHPEIIDSLGGRAAHPDWNEVDFVTSWWNDANPEEKSQFANIQQYADSLQNAPGARWSTGPGAGPERPGASTPAGATTPSTTPTTPTTPAGPATSPTGPSTTPTSPTAPVKPTGPSAGAPGATGGNPVGATGGATGGTVPSTTTSAPIARGFRDILNAINGNRDLGNFNDLELDQYLPYGEDDATAAANTAQLLGYNPGSGNPFANMLQSLAPDIASVASDYLASQGNNSANSRNVAQSVVNTLGSGKSTYLDADQGRQMLERIYGITTGAKPTDANQQLLQTSYADPTNAFKGYINALSGGISPYFLNNSQLLSKTRNNLYRQFNQQAPASNNNFLGFLLGK